MILSPTPIYYRRYVYYRNYAHVDNWDKSRWPNFAPHEFACKCGGRFCEGAYTHDPVFLDALQALRDRMHRPLHITSGHRCALWNAHVGGAPMSQHKNMAVDISTNNHNRAKLYASAKAVGFTGFGLARTFIHLDQREYPRHWYYKGSYKLWQTS